MTIDRDACGYCGTTEDVVRFQVPGKPHDGATCRTCARAITASHAEAERGSEGKIRAVKPTPGKRTTP